MASFVFGPAPGSTPVRVPAELPSAGVFGQALQFAGQPTGLQQQAFDVLGQAGQQAHGFLDQFGAGRRAEIEEGFGTAANNVLADLASRGLAGSSLNLAGQLGVERERQMALGNLADQIAQQRVGLTTDIGRFQAGTLSESAKQQNALLTSLLSGLGTETRTAGSGAGGTQVSSVNWPDRTGPAEDRFPASVSTGGVSAGGGGGGGSGGGGGGRIGGGGASNLSPLLTGLANQYAAGAGAAGQAAGQAAGSVSEAIGGALSGAGAPAADAFGAAAPGVGSGLGALAGAAAGAPFGAPGAGAAAGGYLGNLLGDLFGGGDVGPEGEPEEEEEAPEEEQPEEGGLAPAAQRASDFQWLINKALGLV